jgi:hypothetical protein
MCNLYNLTTLQEAIRALSKAFRDILGNLEPSIDIYPNRPVPWFAMRLRECGNWRTCNISASRTVALSR